MKLRISLIFITFFFLGQAVLAQSEALTPEQKAEAANVITAEYRLQRAWGAAIYGIKQPMDDIAGLVALFKLCQHEQGKFGDTVNGGEWHRLTGSECPVKYERTQVWKGKKYDSHIAYYEVDDDTFYSTDDPKVLAELNITSIMVSWDIRQQEPSPYNKTFEIDFEGYGKAKAKYASASEIINEDIKKYSAFNSIELPDVTIKANAYTWRLRSDSSKKFSQFLLNGENIDNDEYQKYRIL